MEPFRARLGEAIGEGLGQNGIVVVVVFLKLAGNFIDAEAGGQREGRRSSPYAPSLGAR